MAGFCARTKVIGVINAKHKSATTRVLNFRMIKFLAPSMKIFIFDFYESKVRNKLMGNDDVNRIVAHLLPLNLVALIETFIIRGHGNQRKIDYRLVTAFKTAPAICSISGDNTSSPSLLALAFSVLLSIVVLSAATRRYSRVTSSFALVLLEMSAAV